MERIGCVMSANNNTIELIDFIEKYYSNAEFRELCLHLGIDYDSLDADGKRGKARELILYTDRHQKKNKLVSQIKKDRPFFDLPSEVDNSTSQSHQVDNFNSRLAILIGAGIAVIILLAIGYIIFREGLITTNVPTPTSPANSTFIYQVRVQDKASLDPIANVAVTLDLPGTLPEPTLTDSNGLAVFTLGTQFNGRNALLHVDKDGYEGWNQNITLSADERPYDVRITSVP